MASTENAVGALLSLSEPSAREAIGGMARTTENSGAGDIAPTVDSAYRGEAITDATIRNATMVVAKHRAPPSADTSISHRQFVFVVDDSGKDWTQAHVDATQTRRTPSAGTTVLSQQALNQYWGETAETMRILDSLEVRRTLADPNAMLGSELPVKLEVPSSGLALLAPSNGAIPRMVRFAGIADDTSFQDDVLMSNGGPFEASPNTTLTAVTVGGSVPNMANTARAQRWTRTAYILGGRWGKNAPYQMRFCSYPNNGSPHVVPDLGSDDKRVLYSPKENDPMADIPLAFMGASVLDDIFRVRTEAQDEYTSPPLFYRGAITSRMDGSSTQPIVTFPVLCMANQVARFTIVNNEAVGNGDEYSQSACRAASTSAIAWRGIEQSGESTRRLLF